MESHKRTLFKTLSYRLFGTFATAAVAWIVTGRAALGLTIGIADSLVKMVVYYLHERAWARISIGRVQPGRDGDGI
jgi:uncharacterized membrane protein